MRLLLVAMLAVAGMAPLEALARAPVAAETAATPLSGPEYLLIADQALRDGRLDQAGTMIDMLERDPNGAPADDIHLLRAEYLIATGKYAEAELTLAQIGDRTRNPCRLAPLLGWAAERNGRLAEAIEQYRAATSACPDDPGLWNRLALALGSQGAVEDSQAAFEKALGLAPDNTGIMMNYAVMLINHGELPEALALSNRAMALAPTDPHVIAISDFLQGASGQTPERGGTETDNQYAKRLLNAAKGARMTGQDALVQSLKAQAMLLLDRYDMDLVDIEVETETK